MDIQVEILKLQASRLLSNAHEINDFECAIENIVSLRDVTLVKDLCSGFDDQTKDHEVMFGLIHAIEDYDGEEGLFEMAKILKPLQGLPNIPEYNKNEKDTGESGSTYNFSQSPKSPLLWNKKITDITDIGTYYFYLVRTDNPGNVTGSVSIQKGDSTIHSI